MPAVEDDHEVRPEYGAGVLLLPGARAAPLGSPADRVPRITEPRGNQVEVPGRRRGQEDAHAGPFGSESSRRPPKPRQPTRTWRAGSLSRGHLAVLGAGHGVPAGGGGGAEARGCSPFGGPIGMSRGGGGPCRPARRGEVSGAPRTRRTPRSPRWVRRAVRSSGRYWPPRMSSAWPTRVTCLATPGVARARGFGGAGQGGGPGRAGRRALRRTPGPRRRRGLVRGWCRGWWWPRLRSG